MSAQPTCDTNKDTSAPNTNGSLPAESHMNGTHVERQQHSTDEVFSPPATPDTMALLRNTKVSVIQLFSKMKQIKYICFGKTYLKI